MRTIGVVTTSRADFGIYRPVLRHIQETEGLALELYVTGGHLEADQGDTVKEIEREGLPIVARVSMGRTGDRARDIAAAMGAVTSGFGPVFDAQRPDILVVLGDRYEMFAAVAAAVPFRIPIAHIHGGETTEGAIDDVFRHAITKMAHLHFTATEAYAERVRQLGEEAWRVHVSGAPSLDNLKTMKVAGREELESRLGLPLDVPPLVVTFHPVTLQPEQTEAHVRALLDALDDAGDPVVFTYPNADTMGSTVRTLIEAYVAEHEEAVLVSSLGTFAYFGLLRSAAAMVGNSSSGIIEAASLGVPTVDIGDRQKGRIRPSSVIHAAPERDAIAAAIRRAKDPAFRSGIQDVPNPYGDGFAAARIVGVLQEVRLDDRLLQKRWPQGVSS